MPPLWLWFVLGIATVLAFAIVYRLAVVKRENDFRSQMAYVQTRMHSSGNTPVVLVLGSSLTQAGLDKTCAMEENVRQLSGKDVTIIKIWKRATSLETMAEQMHDLEKLHPRLLIVEANMFCYASEAGLINQTLQMIRQLAKFDPLYQSYQPDLKPGGGQYRKGGLNDRGKVVDTTQINLFRQFVKKIQEKGTEVLLINFPIEEREERKKWQSADTLLFNRNYNYLKAQVPFQFYRPDFYLDSSYFLDQGHMNGKGCTKFSQWMCGLIANHITRL